MSIDTFREDVAGENAFAILSLTDRCLRQMGASKAFRDGVQAGAKRGDYDALVEFCARALEEFRDGVTRG